MAKYFVKAVKRSTGKVLFVKELKDCRITATPDSKSHKKLFRLKSLGGGYQSPYDTAPWDTPREYDPSVDYFVFSDTRHAVVEQGNTPELGNYIAIASLGEKEKTYSLFVHVDRHNFPYDFKITPGTVFCRIDPAYTPQHLHIDSYQRDGKNTKDLVWYKDEVKPPVVDPSDALIRSLKDQIVELELKLKNEISGRITTLEGLRNIQEETDKRLSAQIIENGELEKKLEETEKKLSDIKEAVIAGTVAEYLTVPDLLKALFTKFGGK